MPRAIVIGAGVGGLTAAAALQRRGWEVTVLERAAALAPVGAGLALAPNALRALDVIGVGDRVRAQSALRGAAGITTSRGRWISRTDAATAEARFGDPTVVLHRAALVELLTAALAPGTLRLGVPAELLDAATGRVRPGTAEPVADLVVAADGIDSRVRRQLFPDHPGPVYAGVTSWRFVVPSPAATVLPIEAWGAGLVFGLTLLGDGRVYCYATAPAAADGHAADERAELARLFAGWPAPIPELIAAAPAVLRTDIRCLDEPLGRFHAGRVALLGDAAHPMTPNLGQGGCQAIEDAVVLAAYAGSPDGLSRYSAERLPRTRAVAAASRRIGRISGLRGRVPEALRNTGMRLAGRFGPGLVLRQLDPVLGWRPPEGGP